MEQEASPARWRVLVADHEPVLRAALLEQLRAGGYDVRAVGTGVEVLEAVDSWRPDLVLLDDHLPDRSGVDLCRRIRARKLTPRPSLVVLSPRNEEIDRVVAFEVGADDYVLRPFSLRELLLRVRARLVRQTGEAARERAPEQAQRFRVGPLDIDLELYQVTAFGREVTLSPLEMHLLRQLASAGGRVCGRQDLLVRVWNYEPGTNSRTVDTHIKRLREKLGAAGGLIRTVRGRGYRLVRADEPGPPSSAPAA